MDFRKIFIYLLCFLLGNSAVAMTDVREIEKIVQTEVKKGIEQAIHEQQTSINIGRWVKFFVITGGVWLAIKKFGWATKKNVQELERKTKKNITKQFDIVSGFLDKKHNDIRKKSIVVSHTFKNADAQLKELQTDANLFESANVQSLADLRSEQEYLSLNRTQKLTEFLNEVGQVKIASELFLQDNHQLLDLLREELNKKKQAGEVLSKNDQVIETLLKKQNEMSAIDESLMVMCTKTAATNKKVDIKLAGQVNKITETRELLEQLKEEHRKQNNGPKVTNLPPNKRRAYIVSDSTEPTVRITQIKTLPWYLK